MSTKTNQAEAIEYRDRISARFAAADKLRQYAEPIDLEEIRELRDAAKALETDWRDIVRGETDADDIANEATDGLGISTRTMVRFDLYTGGPGGFIEWEMGNPDGAKFVHAPWFDRIEMDATPEMCAIVAQIDDYVADGANADLHREW